MANPYSGHSVHVLHSRAGVADADTESIETRIGRHISPQSNGCWLFNGEPSRYGRAHLRTVDGHADTVSVHRFVYETLVGPIDEGCHVHHRCETKGCCNPAHLLVLTPKEHSAEHHVDPA